MPDEWYELVRGACRKKALNVCVMSTENFVSLEFNIHCESKTKCSMVYSQLAVDKSSIAIHYRCSLLLFTT